MEDRVLREGRPIGSQDSRRETEDRFFQADPPEQEVLRLSKSSHGRNPKTT